VKLNYEFQAHPSLSLSLSQPGSMSAFKNGTKILAGWKGILYLIRDSITRDHWLGLVGNYL
jgi:hypothetical protein